MSIALLWTDKLTNWLTTSHQPLKQYDKCFCKNLKLVRTSIHYPAKPFCSSLPYFMQQNLISQFYVLLWRVLLLLLHMLLLLIFIMEIAVDILMYCRLVFIWLLLLLLLLYLHVKIDTWLEKKNLICEILTFKRLSKSENKKKMENIFWFFLIYCHFRYLAPNTVVKTFWVRITWKMSSFRIELSVGRLQHQGCQVPKYKRQSS